tara:strand:+ start:2076 stop:2567 length:492 start_codon:yes stop_codon:yes gene_type:complete
MNYSKLLDSILNEMDAFNPPKSLLQICESLSQNANSFDWVGFYFMNSEKNTLHLGPYIGEKTDHVEIPYGRGICGQVANSGNTYIAEDINSESNYIACSIHVKSEIVVPIYHGEKLVAQLDIDSHKSNAFGVEEKDFVENLCSEIGRIFGESLEYKNFKYHFE